MNFFLGAPNGQYFDSSSSPLARRSSTSDTTRVDRFGIKLAMLVHAHDGSEQEIGENFATFQESRRRRSSGSRLGATEFKSLATDQAPFGIPSPGNDRCSAGRPVREHLTGYAAANGDSSDTTRRSSAAVARWPPIRSSAPRSTGTSQDLTTAQQADPTQYYKSAPANYYASSGTRIRSTPSSTASRTTISRDSPRTSASEPAVHGGGRRF